MADDRKRQLHHLYKDLEDELKDAEANVEKPLMVALQTHIESLLREVEGELKRALVLTWELAGLVPDRAGVIHEQYQDNKQNVMARVRRALSKMSSTPPPVNTSSTNSTNSAHSYSREASTILSPTCS